jgi:tetratricopeptide (TPR) repeat protein
MPTAAGVRIVGLLVSVFLPSTPRAGSAQIPSRAPGLIELAAAAPALPPREETIEQFWERGTSAFESGNLREALRLFNAALAKDESRARSWNYVGGVHFAMGDLLQAHQFFQRALVLDPRDVRACNNLGTALERLGEYAQAESAYQRAALIDPAYPLTQRNLGLLYSRRLGNPEAARRAWLRYLELAPTGAHAEEVRGELDALPGTPPQTSPGTATQ